MIESPFGRTLEKAHRWGLIGIEGCGDVKVGSWVPLIFLGYKSIHRRNKYVSGATRGPRGWGHALLPRGRLMAFLTSTASLLVCFRYKKDHREGFIPFGIPFLQSSKTRKKHKLALALG